MLGSPLRLVRRLEGNHRDMTVMVYDTQISDFHAPIEATDIHCAVDHKCQHQLQELESDLA